MNGKDEIMDCIFETLPPGSYWRVAYEEAPELAKEYYRINSPLLPDDADESVMDELEDKLDDIYERLDDESWRYILSKTSGPSKLGLGRIWMDIRAKQGRTISSERR